MTDDKLAKDTKTFRKLEIRIDEAYRDIAAAQEALTSGLDTDDYHECFSAISSMMNSVETIRQSREVIDQLDIDWENL